MFDLFWLCFGLLVRLFRSRESLLVENLTLPQQLGVFKRTPRRPRLAAMDKLFWVAGMMMTHAQAPNQSRISPEWRNAVLHARISIGDHELMAADIPNAEPMRSAYLRLRMDSDVEAERVFAALSDGGRVLMPIQDTFFASRFGQVQDRFGINWMILNERPVQPRLRKARRISRSR